jgi:hypothetical protein
MGVERGICRSQSTHIHAPSIMLSADMACVVRTAGTPAKARHDSAPVTARPAVSDCDHDAVLWQAWACARRQTQLPHLSHCHSKVRDSHNDNTLGTC